MTSVTSPRLWREGGLSGEEWGANPFFPAQGVFSQFTDLIFHAPAWLGAGLRHMLYPRQKNPILHPSRQILIRDHRFSAGYRPELESLLGSVTNNRAGNLLSVSQGGVLFFDTNLSPEVLDKVRTALTEGSIRTAWGKLDSVSFLPIIFQASQPMSKNLKPLEDDNRFVVISNPSPRVLQFPRPTSRTLRPTSALTNYNNIQNRFSAQLKTVITDVLNPKTNSINLQKAWQTIHNRAEIANASCPYFYFAGRGEQIDQLHRISEYLLNSDSPVALIGVGLNGTGKS